MTGILNWCFFRTRAEIRQGIVAQDRRYYMLVLFAARCAVGLQWLCISWIALFAFIGISIGSSSVLRSVNCFVVGVMIDKPTSFSRSCFGAFVAYFIVQLFCVLCLVGPGSVWDRITPQAHFSLDKSALGFRTSAQFPCMFVIMRWVLLILCVWTIFVYIGLQFHGYIVFYRFWKFACQSYAFVEFCQLLQN